MPKEITPAIRKVVKNFFSPRDANLVGTWTLLDNKIVTASNGKITEESLVARVAGAREQYLRNLQATKPDNKVIAYNYRNLNTVVDGQRVLGWKVNVNYDV